jgi:hypothetical protein
MKSDPMRCDFSPVATVKRGIVQTLALATLGSAWCLGAAESKSGAAPWVSLFNGRDLTGWRIVALADPAPAVVEDGAMVLRQRLNTKEHTFVTSEREYGDFILELDLKDDPDFNSGILLRCVTAPADAAVRLNGYQVKIDNTPRAWTGGVFDDFGDSWTWLHDLADNARGRAAFKLGEWARFRIECNGSVIKVWVNGVPTCHLVDEKYRQGSIAFKIHSVGNNPKAIQNAIRLKNIRIITEQPGRYAQPMELPPRRAPTTPGKYDKAKPRRTAATAPAEVRLYFDPAIPQIAFAAGDIKAALERQKLSVQTHPLAGLAQSGPGRKIVLAAATDQVAASLFPTQGGKPIPALGAQAYALRTTATPDLSYWVLGGDANGVMYGGLQLAENLTVGGFGGSFESEESPFLLHRGMKLNLPLDRRIPTYVGRWTSNSAMKAIPHVWDLTFWKTLVDQQARHRYNVLSVWVHHPFPALVKVSDYPKVCLPRIEGFDGFVREIDHDQRVAFWREVMRYAHDRGMTFYFFNWNIHLEHAKDEYPAITQDPKNQVSLDYMYKSMRALLETYPELDGFGITAGDGMKGTAEENTTWTWNAMGKSVRDYLSENPSRTFNLINRSVGSSPEAWLSIYAPLKSLPKVRQDYSAKYAMAHMYSTPRPQWTGTIANIKRLGEKTWLTIRNDDYFYLNWGDPKFVRDFLAGIPHLDAVMGMYIGSDGFNPSRTYFCRNESLNGQLEVERRWYMEMLWGRLSYNPGTSDEVLTKLLAQRYPGVASDVLFAAWALASRPLPKVTELVMGEWKLDFHWYPEACWSGRGWGFRTIDAFANETTVAKGSELCDIASSAKGDCKGKKSSYTVADEMQADARKALELVQPLASGGNAELELALNNVRQMAYLSTYYAHKIRGATFKKAGETAKAREEMGQAYRWWIKYTRAMEGSYLPDSFRNTSISPDWKFADAVVLKEYTDLGGTGVPAFISP